MRLSLLQQSPTSMYIYSAFNQKIEKSIFHENVFAAYDLTDLSKITIDGSGRVSNVKSISGDAPDLIQSIESQQPIFCGSDGVLFDGIDDNIKCQFTAPTQYLGYTIYLLFKKIGVDNACIFDGSITKGDTNSIYPNYHGEYNRMFAYSRGGFSNYTLNQNLYNATGIVFDYVDSVINVNGNEVFGNTGNRQNINGITLGCYAENQSVPCHAFVKYLIVSKVADDFSARKKIIDFLTTML